MKKLLIVESPAKIKTISKILGKDFKIMSTVGHIKDLPPKQLGIVLDETIIIEYDVLDGKKKVIADICKEARTAQEIYLAPDPDREGEIIAWHIGTEIEKVIKKDQKIHRISFNEITQPAIEDALAHPYSVNMDKVAAQQARRVLDRWVGYEVSPILWQKISKGLSAGRVQSVALKFICDRELEIRNFKPEEYWTIDALFSTAKSQFNAPLTHINGKKLALKNEPQAQETLEKIKAVKEFVVQSIKDSQRIKNPNAPFITSTLQQAAYNQLGFSVQKTMQLAQNLYEGVALDDGSPVALITYMRTDSTRISDVAIKSTREYILQEFGKEYLPTKAAVYSKTKEKAQDAHEAIRPIDIKITPEKIKGHVSSDLSRLYELIWKRFVACQIKPALYAQRQVTIEGGAYTFKITGSTLLFDGYLKVYAEEDEDDKKVVIPKDLAEKQVIDLISTTPKQHFTQAPARYTEASLIKELEREGIGRPSTFATILKTIQARAYTALDTKKRFLPTELGMAVTTMLQENLPNIINTTFTATMELDLDKIAQGELDRDTLLKEFYANFSQDLEQFRGGAAKKSSEPTTIECPTCKNGMLAIRFGKSGSFLGCMQFPKCTYTSNFERTEDGTIVLSEPAEPVVLQQPCPTCSKPLRQIIGKFGPFIACSGYPECKYIHQNKAGFPCPACSGDIFEKNWKGKKFWGCKNYPNCTFSIPGEIEETPCPQCQTPYLLKRTQKDSDALLLMCHGKECGHKEELESN